MPGIKICAVCGEGFVPVKSQQKYCSKKCSRDHDNMQRRWREEKPAEEKQVIDVSAGKCTGTITPAKCGPFPQSICWECGRRVSDCTWLADKKMYPKTKYRIRKVAVHATGDKIYIVDHCPQYIGGAKNGKRKGSY